MSAPRAPWPVNEILFLGGEVLGVVHRVLEFSHNIFRDSSALLASFFMHRAGAGSRRGALTRHLRVVQQVGGWPLLGVLHDGDLGVCHVSSCHHEVDYWRPAHPRI